jgi:hypothetical protein
MALLSAFRIDAAAARTFQRFLYRDMPDALLPTDPASGQPWYSSTDLEVRGRHGHTSTPLPHQQTRLLVWQSCVCSVRERVRACVRQQQVACSCSCLLRKDKRATAVPCGLQVLRLSSKSHWDVPVHIPLPAAGADGLGAAAIAATSTHSAADASTSTSSSSSSSKTQWCGAHHHHHRA